MSLKHSIDILCTPLLPPRQFFVVNVKVSESYIVKAEVAQGEFQVLGMEDHAHEYSIPTSIFSFNDLSSSRCYDFYEQKLLLSQPRMHPTTRRYLVNKIIEYGMSLVSVDIDIGYAVDARLYVEYSHIVDEEKLALYCQFDDLDDDEANTSFKGVEKGKYKGGDDKEEVITCSVCLEDLSLGTEFYKLPCSHVFHKSCVDPWLETNKSCPNCRTILEDKDSVAVAMATLLQVLNNTSLNTSE